MITTKSKSDIELMRKAGRVVALALEEMGKHVKPGITANELDKIAEEFILGQGCIPAWKGLYGFPCSVCISFNEEVVHGIPSRRVLKEGDLIKLDVGVTYKGWNGDACATFGVGKISPEAEQLMRVAHEAALIGIEQARDGNHIATIGNAIADHVEKYKYGIVRHYVGHGIGRKVHEDPQVAHFRQKPDVKGIYLKKGMCITVEPMINTGSWDTYVKPDKWTVKTADGSLSAQFEHTLAITDSGPEILTVP